MPKLKRYKQEARVVRHQSAIIDFFLKNQNARDHEVHKWARDLGLSPEALEGEIFHLLSCLLKGVGKHAHVPDEAFDQKELEMGVKVEMEHTDNEDVAKIIAKDHLWEIGDYYSRLIPMEEEGKGIKDDNGAGAEFANLISSVHRRLGEKK